MRILICGSRTWKDSAAIEGALFDYGIHRVIETHDTEHLTVIEGGANGADKIAGEIAQKNDWKLKVYPADWQRYGKAAGFIRNSQMLHDGKPDLVLAFWDGKSRGTAMMIELAEKAGVEVKIFYEC